MENQQQQRDQQFASTAGGLIANFLSQHLSPKGKGSHIFSLNTPILEPILTPLRHLTGCSGAAEPHHTSGLSILNSHNAAAITLFADGFARESGQIPICLISSGATATSLLTAVTSAYSDAIPMVIISVFEPALHHVSGFGNGAPERASSDNNIELFHRVTRYNMEVGHQDQIYVRLMAALHHAVSPVPGPVHISIPADLLTLPILKMDEPPSVSHSPFGLIDHQPGLPHEDVLAALQLTLDHCRQGTLLIGNGCEGAMQHILLFAETRQWPIVSTPMGRGLISSNNPLYKGVFGIAGHESARQAMQGDADNLILFIGSDINQYTTCNWDGSTVLDNQLPDRLIHIDANSDYLARSGSARMQILASPEQLFKHLNEQSLPIPEVSDSEPFCSNRHLDRSQKLSLLHLSECLSHHTPINPRHLFWYLSQHAPDNSRVHIDSGTLSYWAIHYWHQHYRHDLNQNLLRLSLGFSTPGWSIGSAIGAAIANGDAPIIAIFNSEDFAARAADLARMKQRGNHLLLIAISTTSEPSINFEVDDRDELQTYEFDISPICPLKPMALAEAIGIPALSITSSALLEDIPLKSLLSKGGPRLLEIMIDGTIAPPIGQATNSAT